VIVIMCAEAKIDLKIGNMDVDEETKQARRRAGLCPDCGGELIHQEANELCRSCGYSRAPC